MTSPPGVGELILDTASILRVNYRNSKNVSELANQLLKVKIARFGSIDKESNFLIGRLEKQGKNEQATAIYESILKTAKPNWQPIDKKRMK